MGDAILYERLAVLFSYPADGHLLHAHECLGTMDGESNEAAAAFREFYAGIEGLGTEELQELFTRTFDLNPMCTLEIGWQLYGEDYQRGEFLVKMRQQLREYDLPESGELPDHLSHALMLLGRLEPEEAAEFATSYLLPAIDKMRGAWHENRNAFAALLESAFALLKSRYPYDPGRTPAHVPELHVLQ
jgi:nitrate reductase delta subunit